LKKQVLITYSHSLEALDLGLEEASLDNSLSLSHEALDLGFEKQVLITYSLSLEALDLGLGEASLDNSLSLEALVLKKQVLIT